MDANESPQTARDCVNHATAAKCPCCDRKCTKPRQDLLRSLYRALVVYPGSAVGMATLVVLYVDVNADLFEEAVLSAAAIVGMIIGFFAQGLRWLPKRGSYRLDRGAVMDWVKSGIRTVAIGLFAWIALVAFVFACLLYTERNLLWAIITTGMLSVALLVIQTANRNVFRSRTWNTWVVGKTAVVGVSIYCSAMNIGVSSYGDVFSAASDNNVGGMIAVLIQQAVLTCGAWILVKQFIQSDTVRSDHNTQGG